METMTSTGRDIVLSRYDPSYDGDIMILCQLFVKESLGEYGISVSHDRFTQMIELCKESSFFLVDGERPVGVIAGIVVNSLTDGRPALQEVIWYVNPMYRRHGHRLLRAFEILAKNVGVKTVVMASMCNSMHERVDRIYKKLGYTPFEVQYIKEI